jgi:hypothetical protein
MLNLTKLKRVVLLWLSIVCASVSSGHGQSVGGPFVVHVTVSDTTGMPVANATVMFVDSSNYINQARTDSTGVFPMSLPVGAYTVKIMASGWPVQYYAVSGNTDMPVYRFLLFSDTTLNISLTLLPQKTVTSFGIVSGSVLDSTGKPLYGAQVSLYLIGSNSVSAGMTTDPAGKFSVSVPAMPHRIWVNSSMYPNQYWTPNGTTIDPVSNTTLQVMPNDTVKVVIMMSTHPGSGTIIYPPRNTYGFISGKVLVRTTNQPAAGLMVIAVPRDSTMANSRLYVDPFYTPYADTCKADGSYRIDTLPHGLYWVYARGGAYITQFFPQTDVSDNATPIYVDSTGRVGIDFFVRPGGTISGQLTSGSTGSLDSMTVYANMLTSTTRQWAVTTGGGRFTITGLATGTWNLSVGQGKGYYADNNAGSSQFYVEEGKTVANVVLHVSRGGFIAGPVLPPLSQDSLYQNIFEIALYPDSILRTTNLYPYEIQTTWASGDGKTGYISGTLPAGSYRVVFRPYAPVIPRTSTLRFVPCRSYSLGGMGPIATLRQSPLYTIVAGDTLLNVPAHFAPAYSFLGTMGVEGTVRPGWMHVDACIRDGASYITVSRGFMTTGDTMFQLTGLVDEKDYYLRCEAEGYPSQWWAPGGAMSTSPAAPYHFSTAAFVQPGIRMVRTPSGYYNNFTPFSVSTRFDSTNHLVVQWNMDMSVAVDTFVLYSKDKAGTVSVLATVPFRQGQAQYSWTETRDLTANQYSYVVIGKGSQQTVRSPTAGYDYYNAGQVAADSLWFSVFGDRHGISMSWSAGKGYQASLSDSILLYRKTGTGGTWVRLHAHSSRNTWLSDYQWDKVVDAGKTFYYRLSLVGATAVIKQSGIRSFTIDTAFVNHLSSRLVVGINEKYKTIQSAIDNARDFDDISVSPGTYVENISLRGKVLEIDGDWQGGVPPVIDGNGGTAITIPYPVRGSWNSVSVSGLKIKNALIGINSSTNVNVNQCLFVNIVKQAMTATIDSASMVRSAQADPFNQYNVQLMAWQCTFIGNPGSGFVAHVGSQGVFENSSSASVNPYSLMPATSFSSGASINNSILAGYGTALLPLDMYGSRGGAYFSNCDFWNTSTVVSTSQQNRITVDSSNFKVDPQFRDSTNYFLPDSSALRTMADNMSGIGYDGKRMYNGGSDSGGPRPSAVQNFRCTIAGARSIRLSWSPLSSDQNAVRYVVSRCPGADSLWYVNGQSQWEPKISQSDMFSIIDTFTTPDTIFTDTTPQVGVPYIYAVAGVTATGQTGEVDFPASRPLSSYIVRLKSLSAVTGVQATVLSFSAASFRWPATNRGSTYSVYKIGLNAAILTVQPDSAAVRSIIRTRMYTSIDSFATRDTTFIDTSIIFCKPYCYVVTSMDSSGMRLPLEQMPFSFSLVWIVPETFAPARSIRAVGQTWNMVGPWGSGALSFAKAIGSDLYHWDDLRQPDKLYSQYAPSSEMRPGSGYWFMPARDTVLSVDSETITALSVAAGVTPTLSVFKGTTGWNQVSSTLPFAVSPSWLSTFTTYEWDPDSNQYRLATVLKPWKGYWISTVKDTVLPLAGLPVSGSLAKKAALGAAQWELCVSLIGKKSRDPDNYCGVVPQSLAKTAVLESPEPPQAFDYPQLFFIQPGATAERQKLARLYKVAMSQVVRQEWTIGISPSSENMTVSIDGIASVPEKALVFFVQNGIVYNLRKKNSVSIAAHTETVYGYIVVTSDSRELALYSGIVELRRAYPNPFTTKAFIEFTIPYSFAANGAKLEGETRAVSLNVYSVAGRLVATLVSGNQPVGFYRKVWNGTTNRGSMVSSGYYIVRLFGVNFQKTSTLFKIR